jgi:RimJ/RimL family protein N-acetyltransferase
LTEPQPILQTERLRLRPLGAADASVVQRLAGEHAVADTTLFIPHPYPDGAAEQWIDLQAQDWKQQSGAGFAITSAETGELCGAIGLRLELTHARAELGYWIGVPFWGRGYCTEAAGAVVEFGFTQLHLRRVYACHFVRNPASGRVLQKLGMKPEGRLRQHVRRWDQFEDLECYGLLREEWPISLARLPG